MPVLRDPDDAERDDRDTHEHNLDQYGEERPPAIVPDDERDPFDETPEVREDWFPEDDEPPEPEDPDDDPLSTGENAWLE